MLNSIISKLQVSLSDELLAELTKDLSNEEITNLGNTLSNKIIKSIISDINIAATKTPDINIVPVQVVETKIVTCSKRGPKKTKTDEEIKAKHCERQRRYYLANKDRLKEKRLLNVSKKQQPVDIITDTEIQSI